jgi:hypothetical protein
MKITSFRKLAAVNCFIIILLALPFLSVVMAQEWYVELYTENRDYIAVYVDTRNMQSNLFLEEISCEVKFYDAQSGFIQERVFRFTDDQLPYLRAGLVYLRYFPHPFSTARLAQGGDMHYSKKLGGGSVDDIMTVPQSAKKRSLKSIQPIGHIEVTGSIPKKKSAGVRYYNIIAKHSGKVMGVAANSRDNGASIVQWPDTGVENQKWRLISAGGGYFKIMAKHSGKVMGVAANSRDNGASIVQWPDTGVENQKWRFVLVGID